MKKDNCLVTLLYLEMRFLTRVLLIASVPGLMMRPEYFKQSVNNSAFLC